MKPALTKFCMNFSTAARGVSAKHNALPCRRDYLWAHVTPRFFEQFGFDQALGFLRVFCDPVSQLGMRLGKFLCQIAFLIQELDARDQHGGGNISFFYDYFARGLLLQTRKPWLYGPSGIHSLLFEESQLIGVSRRQNEGITAKLGDF